MSNLSINPAFSGNGSMKASTANELKATLGTQAGLKGEATELAATAIPKQAGTGREDSNSVKLIRDAIEKVNKVMDPVFRRLDYSIHEKTGDVLVKVINIQTDEVIREIPSEKLLDLAAKLQEMIGLNIDEKR